MQDGITGPTEKICNGDLYITKLFKTVRKKNRKNNYKLSIEATVKAGKNG